MFSPIPQSDPTALLLAAHSAPALQARNTPWPSTLVECSWSWRSATKPLLVVSFGKVTHDLLSWGLTSETSRVASRHSPDPICHPPQIETFFLKNRQCLKTPKEDICFCMGCNPFRPLSGKALFPASLINTSPIDLASMKPLTFISNQIFPGPANRDSKTLLSLVRLPSNLIAWLRLTQAMLLSMSDNCLQLRLKPCCSTWLIRLLATQARSCVQVGVLWQLHLIKAMLELGHHQVCHGLKLQVPMTEPIPLPCACNLDFMMQA